MGTCYDVFVEFFVTERSVLSRVMVYMSTQLSVVFIMYKLHWFDLLRQLCNKHNVSLTSSNEEDR